MDVEKIKKMLRKHDGLSNTLGMEFISTPEPDTCKATMKVDERNKQAFGFLSGGASLALAENLAGVGSIALCPGKSVWASMSMEVMSKLCLKVIQLPLLAVFNQKETPYMYGTLISQIQPES